MSLQRLVRRIIEKAPSVHVLPVGHVALAFEWEHLRRFFAHFAIDCVFDVGANAGQYATMLRTRVGYRGPIVSYEPIPELASKIRSAAALEHVWFVEGLALDATEGQATLNIFASDQFRSLHSVSAAAEREFHKQVKLERRIEVRTGIACEGVRQNPSEASKRPFLNMPSAPESGCATS